MTRNNMDVKIRRIAEADLPRLNEIDQLLLGEGRVPTWPFSFEAYWSVYHPELTFVAELDGEIAGFLVGYIKQEQGTHSILRRADTQVTPPTRHQRVGWIELIGILPQSQHRGVGRKLVDAFQEECRRNDAIINCLVRDGDERLAKFYMGLGFKKWDVAIYTKHV